MLWWSGPSRLNQGFDGNGTKCTKYNEGTILATTATFIAPGGFNASRVCMLRSVVAVVGRPPDKDWDVGGEIIGWGLALEWMKVFGFPESHHTICLKCYAQCASVFLVFLVKAEAGIECQEKLRSDEASHDPKAHTMVIQRLEIKIPLVIVTSGKSWTKFERVERHFPHGEGI